MGQNAPAGKAPPVDSLNYAKKISKDIVAIIATYKMIQDYIKGKYGHTMKTCWIAHVKSMHGLTVRQANNSKDPNKRVHPCPDKYIVFIEDALAHYKIL